MSLIKVKLENQKSFFFRFSNHQASFINAQTMKFHRYDSTYKIKGDADFFAKLFFNNKEILKIDNVITSYDTAGLSSNISLLHFLEEIKMGKKYYKIFPLTHVLYYCNILLRGLIKKLLPKNIVEHLRSIK